MSQPQIKDCLIGDQAHIRRLHNKINQLKKAGKPVTELEKKAAELLVSGAEKKRVKLASLPTPRFENNLPISSKRADIAKLIAAHQVVVVAGETGSGKTTQLPQICLELGLGREGVIAHTQPRRLAARTVAKRIAEELGQPLGEAVGYQVRFSDQSSDNTAIKLMTDGILLAEMTKDRWLSRYDAIIIDEAHERSLNIDFLLGYLKELIKKRRDLKVIITSATIDVERFSEHFDGAPVIEVSGRSYPVDIGYMPLARTDADEADLSLYDGIAEAVEYIVDLEQRGESPAKGDILVFLPGEREIRETHKRLKHLSLKHTEVLPLYARLSNAEQNKIFAPHRGRRIVLSTNVAETSLTVPGIGYVIDPGTARVSRYSYRSKVQRLPIEAISKASANQRAGRCGRISHGLCIRLYSEEDFESRPDFTEPEIMRSNLASVILQMLHLGLGDIKEFPFVNAPDNRFINDGFKRLEELAAVTSRGQLTQLGKQLAKMPVDPHIAKMLVEANRLGALREMLVIASALATQDPRERPAEKKAQADQKHAQWHHEQSDFMAYVNLWDGINHWQEELSQNQLRKRCQQEYISYLKYREWRDVHHQLHMMAKDLGWKRTQKSVDYQALHTALCAGLLSNVGFKESKDEYLGARNRKFSIFPGSSQRKKKPKWLVSAQLLETSKLFAHTVAEIEPDWVLAQADKVVKRHFFEPHYSVKHGRVMAYEKITLYGLTLVEKRRIQFDRQDPQAAHEIFIRECLVSEQYRGKGKFYRKNLELKQSIEKIEDKTRRRDILVDDEAIYGFYSERIPVEIADLVSFETWRRDVEQDKPDALMMQLHHLATREALFDEAQFPNERRISAGVFKLRYRFDPGHPADGVSVRVPLGFLPSIQQGDLDWLVPGLLRDKCIALVKGLPKALRKHFVPVPDYVDRALLRLNFGDGPLLDRLAEQLRIEGNVKLGKADFNSESLDDFYRFNLQVTDNNGRIIDQGRDLEALRTKLKGRVKKALSEAEEDNEDRDNIAQWDFGQLVRSKTVSKAGVKVTAYPALVDQKDATGMRLFDTKEEAQSQGEKGLARLALLALPGAVKQAKKDLFKDNQVKLVLAAVSPRDPLIDDLLLSVSRDVFQLRDWPRDHKEFEARIEGHRNQFLATVLKRSEFIEKILIEYGRLRALLRKTNSLALVFAVGDIKAQWAELLAPGFIWRTPQKWLEQYPRYLQGSFKRLEQVQGKVHRDTANTKLVDEFLSPALARLNAQNGELWQSEEDLVEFRYMIEEWRIQLFAQPMKSIVTVSEKRIKQAWSELNK